MHAVVVVRDERVDQPLTQPSYTHDVEMVRQSAWLIQRLAPLPITQSCCPVRVVCVRVNGWVNGGTARKETGRRASHGLTAHSWMMTPSCLSSPSISIKNCAAPRPRSIKSRDWKRRRVKQPNAGAGLACLCVWHLRSTQGEERMLMPMMTTPKPMSAAWFFTHTAALTLDSATADS